MNTKKLSLLFLTILCSLIMGMSFYMYMDDPLFIFHKPYGKYEIKDELYQNNGIAKHFDYDAVVLGSSMTDNFRISWFQNAFDVNLVKLSYSGGTTANLKLNMESMFQSKNKIDYVFTALDNYLFVTSSVDYRFDIEDYVRNPQPSNIFKYLLNKQQFINYFQRDASKKDNYYVTEQKYKFGKKQALGGRKYQPIDNNLPQQELDKDLVYKNLDNIIPFVKNNPQTQFYFFAPPYSMVYWYDVWNGNRLDSIMEAQKMVYNELLQYDNVKLFYLQDNLDITSNLNNYKDYSHYNGSINKLIVDTMEKDIDRLTYDNINQVLDAWKVSVNNYDYKAMFD
ncbi:MAG: hypothetical protein RR537_04765 [Longicatena sp.]